MKPRKVYAGELVVGDLHLHPQTMIVARANQEIRLAPQEFRLLQYLMENKGHILTRKMILNQIWRLTPELETKVVDVYIGYLRKKIDKNFEKSLLHSVRGFGYVMKE